MSESGRAGGTPRSPRSLKSPASAANKAQQVFNFPETKSPKCSNSSKSSKSSAPMTPLTPKLPMHKSPRSPRSPRLSGPYEEQENYFNFNIPSPKKVYSQTKVLCQQCPSSRTPSLEFKLSNVEYEAKRTPPAAGTPPTPKCNIRSNPGYTERSGSRERYASSTSINESVEAAAAGSSRCRKSTSDLTEDAMDGSENSLQLARSLSRPASPRRRGSMKGGLAYLASRRGSRDSLASNASNLSNEDIGPLNFQNTVRGRQRRTSNFLELPVPDHVRPRVCSLPEKAYNPRFSDDLYRLRTFSITNKGGVVNCGDSILNRRSRSNTSVNSTASGRASNVSGERSPFEGSCCGSGYHTVDSTPLGSPEEREIPKYRVVLLGEAGVGKTALVSQFMTSEYMNTYDASLDDEFGEKTVSVLLDRDESDMVFIDHPAVEMSVENSLSTYEPHACVVVYSITSKESFQAAEEILNYLWRERYTHEKSVIVVANKADLARSRVISSSEGKALAVSRDCKFIETSSGIQHNVDELLVGILKQIRLRESRDRKQQQRTSRRALHGSKTSLSLNIAREILHKICINDISKSKSCENLHVL